MQAGAVFSSEPCRPVSTRASLLRFVLVGSLTTGLNLAIFVLLIRLGLHYLAASTVGWAAGLLTSFLLNKNYTFAVPGGATSGEAARFLGTSLSQLLLGAAGYVALIDGLRLAPVPAFFVNLVLVSLFSFTCMKLFVFRPPSAAGSTASSVAERPAPDVRSPGVSL